MTYIYRHTGLPDTSLQRKIEILQAENSALSFTVRQLEQQIVMLNAVPHNFRRSEPVCGTSSGYQRHIRARTKPCNPCKYARAQYVSDYRSRKKQEEHDGLHLQQKPA